MGFTLLLFFFEGPKLESFTEREERWRQKQETRKSCLVSGWKSLPDLAVEVLVTRTKTRENERVGLTILDDLVLCAEKVLEVSQQANAVVFASNTPRERQIKEEKRRVTKRKEKGKQTCEEQEHRCGFWRRPQDRCS